MTATSNPFEARAREALGRGCSQVGLNGTTLLAASAVECGTSAQGADSGIHWDLCQTREELEQSISHEMNLGVGLGPLPLFQAKRAFVNQLHSTIFSLSLVVKAHQTRRYSAIQTKPNQPFPSTASELKRFVDLFGDAFVGECAVGGEFIGVYTLYAQSKQQAQQVRTMFQAGVGIKGVTLSPSLLSEISRISQEAKVNMSFRKHVSGLKLQSSSITRESLIREAQRFPTLPLDEPELLDIRAIGYETLPEMPQQFGAIAANRRLFSGDPRTGAQGFINQHQSLLEVRNQIEWVEGTYDYYGLKQDPSLESAKTRLDSDLTTIQQLLESFIASPLHQLQPPHLSALEVGTPSLHLLIYDSEIPGKFPANLRMGGNGGAPFGYPLKDIEAAVAARVRLSSVGFHAGDRVAEFRLTYESSNGSIPRHDLTAEVHAHLQGGGDPDIRWSVSDSQLSGQFGNQRWQDQGTLKLSPQSGGLKRIEAKTGRMVDRLFLSTDGQRIGGGSDAGNRSVDWSPDDNAVVLGFAGRAGRDLDALWPIVAEFLPLQWQSIT